MSRPTFKVGDRVRCIKDSPPKFGVQTSGDGSKRFTWGDWTFVRGPLQLNAVYTVEALSENHVALLEAPVSNSLGPCYLSPDRFELVHHDPAAYED